MIKTIFSWIKWLLIAAWLVIVVLVGAKLAQQNGQLLEVELLVWRLPEASAGFILAATLLVGVTAGVLALLPSLILFKLRLRRAQGRLRKLDQSSSLINPGPADG